MFAIADAAPEVFSGAGRIKSCTATRASSGWLQLIRQ